jgi:hypothetical protein
VFARFGDAGAQGGRQGIFGQTRVEVAKVRRRSKMAIKSRDRLFKVCPGVKSAKDAGRRFESSSVRTVCPGQCLVVRVLQTSVGALLRLRVIQRPRDGTLRQSRANGQNSLDRQARRCSRDNRQKNPHKLASVKLGASR